MKRSYFFLVSILIALTACSGSEGKNDSVEGETKKDLSAIVAEENNPIPVKENSFFGITLGANIDDYKGFTSKGKIRTGEGVVEVYNIEQRGTEIGYLVPDVEDKTKVGNIFIQSPKAITDHGFKVGTTFKEILAKYPTVEVRGTKVENRAEAVLGKLHYRLDFISDYYDLDHASIPEDAVVHEIVIVK